MRPDKAAPRAHGDRASIGFPCPCSKTYPVWNRFVFAAFFVGLLVSGILQRYGLGAENLVWSLMFTIQPLGCVSYSVAVLPGWLQPICWALCRRPMFSRACAAC